MPQTSPGGTGTELAPRPPHVSTEESRRQARTAAACGLTPEQICLIMNLAMDDFERCYRSVFEQGALQANVQVGSTVLSIAVDRSHSQCFQAASFWLRARANWRDVRSVETTETLPEEQKAKLINQILERLNTPVADFIEIKVKKKA